MQKLYIILIVIILFSFLLPWAYVKVEAPNSLDEQIMKMSGMNFVFGLTANLTLGISNFWTGEFNTLKVKIIDIPAIIVLILTVLFLVLTILTRDPDKLMRLGIVLSAICLILLLISYFFLAKYKIKNCPVEKEFLSGFWLAFLFYLALLMISIFSRKGSQLIKIPAIGNLSFHQTKTNVFCTNCGTKLSQNEAFCPKCGEKIKGDQK